MADKENPNYQLLLEEINNLKEENVNLKNKNNALEEKIDQVIEFNRSLLNKPVAKGVVEERTNDKLLKFIGGE